MTIQRIGGASVALYLTPDDLEARGLSARELDMERALELTEDAFSQAGIPIGGTLEIEAFPNPSGVLVLARVRTPVVAFFYFPDLEDVIRAAKMVPEHQSRLYRTENGYIVALSGEREIFRLSEFGARVNRMTAYEAWLKEHADLILADGALAVLARGF